MKTSAFLRLNLKDFLLGLLFSVLVPIISVIEDSLKQGQLHFDWNVIVSTAIASAIAYIKIAFFSGSKNKIQALENEDSEIIGTRPTDR